LLFASLTIVAPVFAATDPNTVLILVNDLVPPEAGTGSTGASIYVGEYYATRRGIPFSNIVHLSIPLACCDSDPKQWDSWNVGWDKFETYIRTPVKSFLESRGLKNTIKYIVPTYGIPVRTQIVPYPAGIQPDMGSVDSFLAAMYSPSGSPFQLNPYAVTDPSYSKPHFTEWQNPQGWPMYIVARLDGPGATIATGLVDKAISAESSLTGNEGRGYFDYQHRQSATDATMLNAYNLALQHGFPAVLNDQSVTHEMIHSAPGALWAWGWYSGTATWGGYEFVNGAVGAQLTSYTATNIRYLDTGTWVPLWLLAGITATWGATGEPYTSGYANGDNLLNHFWNGYNFGESAYLACPVLNWMMVFVGDPLYAPNAFQRALPPPEATPHLTFSAKRTGDTYSGNLTLFAQVPPGVIAVQFQANGYDAGPEFTAPPYAATFKTTPDDNGPSLLTVKTRDASGQTLISDPVPIILFNEDAPAPPVPTPDGISAVPSSGAGTSQRFTFTFSPAPDASSVNIVIHNVLSAANACYLIYEPPPNTVDLVDDSGETIQRVPPGSGAVLANSQCNIPASSVVVTRNGDTIVLEATVTFAPGFAGPKTIWASWYPNHSAQVPWREIGSWTVQ
jgi:uncharacterized protein (TIGR03790 family)